MHSEDSKSFEEVRAQVESAQKAILWEDARDRGRSVDEFLWKGDPEAKPIQRAGLGVFGVAFLLLSIASASVPFIKHFEDGWQGAVIGFVFGALALAVSLRLFRNAFRRPKRLANGKHHPGKR